jgi:hypothetical protein
MHFEIIKELFLKNGIHGSKLYEIKNTNK